MKTSLTTLARPPARDVLRRTGATLAAPLATVLIFAPATPLADAANAVRIAEAMGVPRSNVLLLNDRQLSAAGIRDALAGLGKRVGRGDGVFVYYSGHGTQTAGAAGKCSEGLLAYDMQVYPDSELEQALGELSSKAGQLVMMNDSCFSGGAAVKALPLAERKAKFFKLASATGDYQCGHALNMKVYKNIVPVAAERGANLLYVAAAADTEIAHATSAGSAATTAWIDCLHQAGSDRDRSGGFSGGELRACAQQRSPATSELARQGRWSARYVVADGGGRRETARLPQDAGEVGEHAVPPGARERHFGEESGRRGQGRSERRPRSLWGKRAGADRGVLK